jgi:hypothetical protein
MQHAQGNAPRAMRIRPHDLGNYANRYCNSQRATSNTQRAASDTQVCSSQHQTCNNPASLCAHVRARARVRSGLRVRAHVSTRAVCVNIEELFTTVRFDAELAAHTATCGQCALSTAPLAAPVEARPRRAAEEASAGVGLRREARVSASECAQACRRLTGRAVRYCAATRGIVLQRAMPCCNVLYCVATYMLFCVEGGNSEGTASTSRTRRGAPSPHCLLQPSRTVLQRRPPPQQSQEPTARPLKSTLPEGSGGSGRAGPRLPVRPRMPHRPRRRPPQSRQVTPFRLPTPLIVVIRTPYGCYSYPLIVVIRTP